MRIRFLKKFRKRFSIKVASEQEQQTSIASSMWCITLIDHKDKIVYTYSDMSIAIAYAANKMGLFKIWYNKMELIKRRQEKRRYQGVCKSQNYAYPETAGQPNFSARNV